MKSFNNKLVYITGGSSGIGLAVARLMAAGGAHIVIFARSKARLERARGEIEAARRAPLQTVGTISMDVANESDVRKKIKSAVSTYGAPDIVITSAGTGMAGRFENISGKAFDALMKTNVSGTWYTVSVLLPFMKKRGGQIIIVASAAGLIGMYGYTAYGASKYALVGFAECLRGELAPRGIAVSVVCPPEVNTPFLANEPDLPAESRAIKDFAGTLKVEPTARFIVKGIASKKFLIIPGLRARFLYLNHRLSNGFLTRVTSDLVTWWVQRSGK